MESRSTRRRKLQLEEKPAPTQKTPKRIRKIKVIKREPYVDRDDEIDQFCETQENEEDIIDPETYDDFENIEANDDFHEEGCSNNFRSSNYTDGIIHTPVSQKFSIGSHLAGKVPEDPIELLKKHIEHADIAGIGRVITEGILAGTLTDVQLSELSHTIPAPVVSMTSYVFALQSANSQELKEFLAGQQFVNSMNHQVSHSLNKFEAKLNSMSSTFNKQHHIAARQKGDLLAIHIAPSVHPFPSRNFNEYYTSKNMTGDKAINQLTNLYSSIFKTYLPNEHDIWLYSFRPMCAKASDKHFKLLPSKMLETLQDFGFDVLGCYLPHHMIAGPIHMDDPFVITLGEDAISQIEYRRKVRDTVSNVVDTSIGFALQTLRNYHYDLDMNKLVYCARRKQCTTHFRWDDLKAFRQRRRELGMEVEQYTIDEVMRTANRSASEPAYEFNDTNIGPYSLVS